MGNNESERPCFMFYSWLKQIRSIKARLHLSTYSHRRFSPASFACFDLKLPGTGSLAAMSDTRVCEIKHAVFASLFSKEVTQLRGKVSGPPTATHPLETRKNLYFLL